MKSFDKKDSLKKKREIALKKNLKKRKKNKFITKAKVEQANKARTNKSALIILYQGCASAETSTLKKNQNQNPPTHVSIAPKCHNTDHSDEVDLSAPV